MNNVYPSTHPLVAHKITRLRDYQTEPKKFRELVRELAALLAYEATADLVVRPVKVQTPWPRQMALTCLSASAWYRSCGLAWGWLKVFGN